MSLNKNDVNYVRHSILWLMKSNYFVRRDNNSGVDSMFLSVSRQTECSGDETYQRYLREKSIRIFGVSWQANPTSNEQDKQRTCNLILRRVRATIVAEKCNEYYILRVCVWSLRYPACNAHAPHWHLWPARLYKTYLNYLINRTFFEKQLLNIKCVFWFSLQFNFSETFFILRITERDMIKNVNWSASKVPDILVTF